MNFDKYVNKLPYPSKGDFTTKYWYTKGKCIAVRKPGAPMLTSPDGKVGMNESVLSGCVSESVLDEVALRDARDAYGREEARIHHLFKSDLCDDLGIAKHPKADKLYAKAWEDGHSAGFAEVYNCALNLVDLIL